MAILPDKVIEGNLWQYCSTAESSELLRFVINFEWDLMQKWFLSAIKITAWSWQQIKASELLRPRAKPRTSIATRTFSFNLAGVRPRACMNAGHSHATVEYACVLWKICDCACGLKRRNTHAHCEKILRLRMRICDRDKRVVIVGRAGRPEEWNRDAHRASIVAAVGMGEQVWDKGKYIKGEKASCQIRTERRTKTSFKKVERSTHGPGSPVHTVSSEEEDVTTSVSDMTTFISKFAGSRARYAKGIKAVKQEWWNITKATYFHSKTAGKPTVFGVFLAHLLTVCREWGKWVHHDVGEVKGQGAMSHMHSSYKQDLA